MWILLNPETIVRATSPTITQCPPGEKSHRGKCTCMFPFECRYVCHSLTLIYPLSLIPSPSSNIVCLLTTAVTCALSPSLEACAVLLQRAPALLGVCKLHSLRCLGNGHTLVENSACQWPVSTTAAACNSCPIWEVCNGKSQRLF